MELDKFISESLKTIIKGVADAQEYALEHDARINPTETANLSAGIKHGSRRPYKEYRTENIEFDIAVQATTGKETQGGIKVATGILNLGSDGQSVKEKQATNRIKFNVSVQLPEQEARPIREEKKSEEVSAD